MHTHRVPDLTVTVPPDARLVPLGPALRVPTPLIVTLIDGYQVVARVEPEVLAGRLLITDLQVTRLPGGTPVTVDGIRNLPLAAMVHAAGVYVRDEPGDGPEDDPALLNSEHLTPENVARMTKAGPTPETLYAVAFVYRRAVATSEPPTRAIEEAFQLSRSKAGRWIALARDAGYLGKSEGAGKASV